MWTELEYLFNELIGALPPITDRSVIDIDVRDRFSGIITRLVGVHVDMIERDVVVQEIFPEKIIATSRVDDDRVPSCFEATHRLDHCGDRGLHIFFASKA